MKVFARVFVCSFMASVMFTTTSFAQGYGHVETADYRAESKVMSESMIKNAFDKFRYQMTVQWDQNDPTFKEHAESEFEKSILELRSQGISSKEIQAYVTKSLLDEKTRSDYESLVAVLKSQGKSEEEIADTTTKFMQKAYQQGASYSGGAAGGWTKAAAIVAMIAVVAITVVILVKEKEDDGDNGDDWDDDYDHPKKPKKPKKPHYPEDDCPEWGW